jgi:hypothetical protein
MLTHVVFFKFNPETSDTDKRHLEEALRNLPGIISEIREFRIGRDIVRSERSYDLALVSGFADLAAMQRYQVHPEHQKVVAFAKTITSSVVAVDFLEP